ncbi:hypothetical protein NQ314_011145 [Rhamnusium bicolor]|uniref:Uncharacterized protein n=1 Tax=Rhamnusium bicolor TaxID=1586634 RepID=A0AAV8XLE9_9CUCU|nr:hypothetical protein NQ314_011145 [Rhamnusium bicolor]
MTLFKSVLVCTYLIQSGEKQEENISSAVRANTISLLCKMNPSQALTIRSKCVELCRMPALAITLSLEHVNKNSVIDDEGDMVAFISGLLLGNDQTIRLQYIKTNVIRSQLAVVF